MTHLLKIDESIDYLINNLFKAFNQTMFTCEDVRVKDGLLNATVIETTNSTQMDSLSAINADSPSPTNSNTGSVRSTRSDRPAMSQDWSTQWATEWQPNNGRQQNNPNRERIPICYNCNAKGHVLRDCLHKKDGRKEGRGGRRDGRDGRQLNRRQYGGNDSNRGEEPIWTTSEELKQQHNQLLADNPIPKEVVINQFPNLHIYYLNEDLSDLKIAINGQTLFAHKLVLSAKSDVFKSMLYPNETKTDEKTEEKQCLELNDINIDAFKLILKFLYFEKLNLKNENAGNYESVIEVLKLANHFKIDRLSKSIETELMQMLDISNLVDICSLTLHLNSKQLLDSLELFVQTNENDLIEKKAFITDSAEVMAKLLSCFKSQNLIIKGLEIILDLKPESDIKQFKQLIDLKKCSIEDIDVIDKIGLFDKTELYPFIRQLYINSIDKN